MNTIKTTTKTDFFKGICQWQNKEYDVLLPIFYYDCSAVSAVYTASTKLIKKYIPGDDLYPIEIFPGRCLVTVSAFEYRKSDLGPYNEFSIAVLVKHKKKPIPLLPVISAMVKNCFHLYIIKLPVTSERARSGGVDLGGYPKFLANIEFKNNKGYTSCSVSDKKNHILTLRGKNLKTSPFRKIRYVIYTHLNNCLINSNLFINPLNYAQSFSRDTATIEIGANHPMSDLLSGIKLGKKPLVYQYIPTYEAILCGNKNIIDN